jgi:hypothetical protein
MDVCSPIASTMAKKGLLEILFIEQRINRVLRICPSRAVRRPTFTLCTRSKLLLHRGLSQYIFLMEHHQEVHRARNPDKSKSGGAATVATGANGDTPTHGCAHFKPFAEISPSRQSARAREMAGAARGVERRHEGPPNGLPEGNNGTCSGGPFSSGGPVLT